MTRLEFFESGTGLIAAKIGVIPVDLLTKYDNYRTYLDFKKDGHGDAESKVLASDKCRCHYASIVRAIYWFERDEPATTELRTRSFRSIKHLRTAENKQAG